MSVLPLSARLKPPTAVEVATGHLVTEATLTLVGALSGSPLAALLPILSNSLASARYRRRVKEALREIDAILNAHTALLRHLSDAQYKLLNESVVALLHTTSPEKIRYLRLAVGNCLTLTDVAPKEAVALSRVIRDISADEASFLVANFHYDRVQLSPRNAEDDNDNVLSVSPDSKDAMVASGLISLGLLIGAGPIMKDIGRYTFSPLVSKLLVLLREPGP